MWATVLGFVGGIAIPLLSRIPAFSADGRLAARIDRDAQLLAVLPAGKSKELMTSGIEDSVAQLIQARRDSVSRSASRRRVFVIAGLLIALVVTGIIGGRALAGSSANTPDPFLVALAIGAVAASTVLAVASYFQMRQLREASNASLLSRRAELMAARRDAVDRLERRAEAILNDDRVDPKTRRNMLAEVRAQLQTVNDAF